MNRLTHQSRDGDEIYSAALLSFERITHQQKTRQQLPFPYRKNPLPVPTLFGEPTGSDHVRHHHRSIVPPVVSVSATISTRCSRCTAVAKGDRGGWFMRLFGAKNFGAKGWVNESISSKQLQCSTKGGLPHPRSRSQGAGCVTACVGTTVFAVRYKQPSKHPHSSQ